VQKCADISCEDLVDRLAHDLERQAIASVACVQLTPLLASAVQLLGGQEHLRFEDAETAQVESADGAAEHG
jgi:hypothetical protein